MIALLRGTIAAITPENLILDVHGIGYEVLISQRTASQLPHLGTTVTLHIHTHVREDQLTLYGFSTGEERALFRRLLSVSGIGPRTALAILSGLAPADLVQAVAVEDAAQLSAIPGIGKKTAERIIIDLRDRLLKDHAKLLQFPAGGTMKGAIHQDALSALVNLGYPQQTAMEALRQIPVEEAQTLGIVIREALKVLAQP
ncbi:MAG: Holliday junction branch migration protein RuvA [Deltaproteobacteria bacterium]|nr:Holliday junction branch migration protein RuvA [Deltaproteobacteria bacterium]